MSTEENKAIRPRFFDEVWHKGNLDAVAEFFTADFVLNGRPFGHEGLRKFVLTHRTAFPDVRLTIEDQVAVGDKVVARFTVKGTHEGDLKGIAPTGKQVAFDVISITRIVNGKIAEEWEVGDEAGMLRQLGAIPHLGESEA